MTKEKTTSQSPEEMAKAAQEAAVKAAMEQAQSMFGNIPGFQMPGGMQEQIMAQMSAGIPDMAKLQAQQEAMLETAGIDPATVALAGMQNMAFAQQMMQETMDGTLGEKLSSSDAMAQMMEAFGDPEPATGFALGIDRIILSLRRDGRFNRESKWDIYVAWAPGWQEKAIQKALELRNGG